MADRTIVVAVDASDASDEAVRQADARARDSGATLVACHVLADPLHVHPLYPVAVPVDTGALRAAAETGLRERVCRLTRREPGEVDVRILLGVPYAGLIEEAERVAASLLVVGSNGRRGLARALLGSVAARVVRHARCPVLVARPRTLGGTVLVATDFSDPALPAVRAAVVEAKRVGGEVVAMHAIDLDELDWTRFIALPGGAEVRAQATAEMRRSARARLEQALAEAGGAGRCEVREGRPGDTILEAAAEIGAEIVIVGTAGRSGFARVTLGSVAEQVVRDAATSVLVVRLDGG